MKPFISRIEQQQFVEKWNRLITEDELKDIVVYFPFPSEQMEFDPKHQRFNKLSLNDIIQGVRNSKYKIEHPNTGFKSMHSFHHQTQQISCC